MDQNGHQLSDPVVDISARFSLVGGKPQLSDDDLCISRDLLSAVARERRSSVASELVALAIKFQRMAGEAAAPAVAQLCVLTGGLLDDTTEAARLFEREGVDLRGAAKRIGMDTKARPVASGKLTEGKNLFALLKDSNNKRKKTE